MVNRCWFLIILFLAFLLFMIIGYKILEERIKNLEQENYHERIEHSLNWSKMLSRKQELMIDKMYEKRIIRFGTYTHRALDRENKLWLQQQMGRKVKNEKR